MPTASRITASFRPLRYPRSANPCVPPSTNSTSCPKRPNAATASSSFNPAPSSSSRRFPSPSTSTGRASTEPAVMIQILLLVEFEPGNHRREQSVLELPVVVQHDVQVQNREHDEAPCRRVVPHAQRERTAAHRDDPAH